MSRWWPRRGSAPTPSACRAAKDGATTSAVSESECRKPYLSGRLEQALKLASGALACCGGHGGRAGGGPLWPPACGMAARCHRPAAGAGQGSQRAHPGAARTSLPPFHMLACPCSVWRRHSHLLCRLVVRPWSCRALPPLELAAGPGQLSHRVPGPACHTSLS